MMLELDLEFERPGFCLQVQFRLGEPLVLLTGPSGAGKTTLLDLIAGFLAPERGWIHIDGETLVDTAAGIHLPPERRRLGYLFQEGRLFPHLSVAGNLRYGLRRRCGDGPGLDETVAVLGLEALLDRRIEHLSGGERQRVALGRALLTSPRLVLLDEPLASLDRDLKERILPYLVSTGERFDIPMLYVSHEPGELRGLAPRVLRLEAGRFAGEDPGTGADPDPGGGIAGGPAPFADSDTDAAAPS